MLTPMSQSVTVAGFRQRRLSFSGNMVQLLMALNALNERAAELQTSLE